MKLNIKNISFNIDEDEILKDLSLVINENEIISVIGPSASGKSSLLRIIAGFEAIDSGERQNFQGPITATVPSISNETVANFSLTLSIKDKSKR